MAKTLEFSHVPPFADSPDFLSDFVLPFTFCDTLWFKFPPVERLFFYALPQPKQTFLESTLPKLKHSLSVTLRHFLPLAGNLTWPRDSPKPIILFTPNDGVSFTVAESDAADDFDILSGDDARKAASFHAFVPKLNVTETGAAPIALQVTLFPNRGFCIGVTCHHAVLDRKSTAKFMKSWAHVCKSEKPDLPPELMPFYDRSVFEDPYGLDMKFLNWWLSLSKIPNPRNDPTLFQFFSKDSSPDIIRRTFKLTKPDIAKLRQKVLSTWEKLDPTRSEKLNLTSFVLTLAYTTVCILQAKYQDYYDGGSGGGEKAKGKVIVGFAADIRSRLRPPVPENYFGNCVWFVANPEDKRGVLKEEDPFAAMATSIAEMIKELSENDVMERIVEVWEKLASLFAEDAVMIGVAGSPRFGIYGIDFGWGKPKKVEIVSVDGTGAIAVAESRDGNGGIEVGVVLNKHQMEVFSTYFLAGIESAEIQLA